MLARSCCHLDLAHQYLRGQMEKWVRGGQVRINTGETYQTGLLCRQGLCPSYPDLHHCARHGAEKQGLWVIQGQSK